MLLACCGRVLYELGKCEGGEVSDGIGRGQLAGIASGSVEPVTDRRGILSRAAVMAGGWQKLLGVIKVAGDSEGRYL